MVRGTNRLRPARRVRHQAAPEPVAKAGGSVVKPDRAPTSIDAWLTILERLLRLPETQRRAIRDELEVHLRERVRDLMLAGAGEAESLRVAFGEIGDAAEFARQLERSNRWGTRRLLMNLSLFGLSAAAVTAGVLALSPARSQVGGSIFQDASSPSEPPAAIADRHVSIEGGTTVEDVIKLIDAAVPQAVIVR